MKKEDIAKNVFSLINKPDVDFNDESNDCVSKFNLFYPHVKAELLRARIWDFALRKCTAECVGEREGLYIYKYPDNCLFIRSVSGEPFNEHFDDELGFRIIATKAKDAYIEFVYNVDDNDINDSEFIEAFALALASDLAVCVNLDENLASSLLWKLSVIINKHNMGIENIQIKWI